MATQPAPQDLDHAIDRAYQIGMLQRREEITPFLQFLKTKHIENWMEIGVFKGATFTLWDTVSRPGLHMAMDPNLQNGIQLSPQQLADRDKLFGNLKKTVCMLYLNSQTQEAKTAVAANLRELRLDFLFIDGDHSQHAVHHDWLVFGQCVRKGGLIALHDIARFTGVAALWRNISAHNQTARTWIAPTEPSGIGCIEVQ